MSSQTLRARLSDRFRALRHRDFRLYFACQFVSIVGTWMQSIAQGWLLHRLDPAPLALGVLSFLQFLPALLLSMWAGVVADRADKRRLLVITQSVALVQAVVMALLVTTGAIRPWMIYSLALVYGVFNAFDLPARQSFLVDIAGKDDLANAIALNSGAFNSARIVGPAVAGVLVAWLPGVVAHLGIRGWFHTPLVGEAGCFWINALSYIAMLWGLARMRPGRRAPASATGTWEHLREGVRYAFADGSIRRLLLLLGFMSGFGWQYTTLLPVYAREILRANADTYGALVSAFGLGSLFSTAVLTREHDRTDLRRNLFVGLGTAGVALAVFAWSRVLAVSLVAGFFAGFGLILYVASTNTMLQLALEDRLRGRVMSLYTLMLLGLAPIGALVVGFIAQHWSAPVATSFCAIVLLAGTLYVSSRIRLAAQRDAATVTTADTSEPMA